MRGFVNFYLTFMMYLRFYKRFKSFKLLRRVYVAHKRFRGGLYE